MKLDQYTSDVKTSGIKSKALGIAVNAKTFSLILDRLYTDIRLAIVRELMTNGYDSQRQAGRGDKPLDITVPTKFSNKMVFRDYGVSMTHDVVEEVYSTLMESTKDDSDDDVGGWGIGSKTPFGYVKEFEVKCFLAGEVRTYHMFINAIGVPEIAHMHTGETTEEDGVEVSFDVKPEDIGAFKQYVSDVSKWFDVKPNTNRDVGIVVLEKRHVVSNIYSFEDQNVTYRYGGRVVYLRQGCVAYPINADSIDKGKADKDKYSQAMTVLKDCSHREYFIDVPVGTCDVTASRDALYYSDKTNENLIELFSNIWKELTAELEKKWAEVSSFYEAMRLKHGNSTDISNAFPHVSQSFFNFKTFNSKTLSAQHLSMSTRQNDGSNKDTYESLKMNVPSPYNMTRCLFRPERRVSFDYTIPIMILVDQADATSGRFTRRRGERVAAYKRENPNTKVYWAQISGQSLDSFNDLVKDLGYPPFMRLSDVEIPEAEKKEKEVKVSKRDLVRKFTANDLSYISPIKQEKLDTILDSDDYMYIYTHRNHPAPIYGDIGWDDLSSVVSGLGIKFTTPVITVSKSNRAYLNPKVKDKNDYVEFLRAIIIDQFDPERYVTLKKTLDAAFYSWELRGLGQLSDDLTEDKDDDTVAHLLGVPLVDDALNLYRSHGPLYKEFSAMENVFSVLVKVLDDDSLDKINRQIETYEKTIDVSLTVAQLQQREAEIFRAYPGLEVMYGKNAEFAQTRDLLTLILSQ